ncbi:MAG: imidazoleglycerol-phosphate dehydratase HisB [Anaerolineae bacterium]
MRQADVERETHETKIAISLNLDGTGAYDITTGLGFLDHMLSHIAVHGLFDLSVRAKGDLDVDPHHTVEDVALTLGAAFDRALGDRKGIVRMGSAYVPMDESLGFAAVDFSGRPYAVSEVSWTGPMTGAIPVTLWEHFFASFAIAARANVHMRVLYGRDDHHKVESLFKAIARALDAATRLDPRRGGSVPSTKGTL